MSKKTPTVEAGVLHMPDATTAIALDTPDWFAWLADDDHHSFHLVYPIGCFTARKERKQRGQWYWVAYRQIHGKLHKTYLGKSETLTEAHLCAAAQTLAAESTKTLDDSESPDL